MTLLGTGRDDAEGPPGPLLSQHRRPGVATRWRGRLFYLAAFVLIICSDWALYELVTRKGVIEAGDEPHYLVVARALSHFTIHPLSAYLSDLRTHQLWPGATPTSSFHLYQGPHGLISGHGLGLPALLASFAAVGSQRVIRLGLIGLETAGLLYVFHRAAHLFCLSRRARIAFAVVLAAPALWLAATQIYPDLPSGILMAFVLVELIGVERGSRVGPVGAGISTFSLAMLPWMHQQNLVAAVFLLVAFVWVLRARGLMRLGLVVAAWAVASWLLLLAYNLYGFGHLLGLPQPFPSLDGAGVTQTLGLLFDRHQGLLVQVPVGLLGLAGLWMSRRKLPVAVAACLASVGSLLVLNGTYTANAYGGGSFAGRFGWSCVIPLLLWCPVVLAALDRSGAALWTFVSVTALLWVLQVAPILRGDHVWYNQVRTWDPAAYAGWWGRIDRLLPVLIPGLGTFGRPWFGLPLAVVLAAIVVLTVTVTARSGRPSWAGPGGVLLATAAVAGALALVAPLPLPGRPIAFTGPDVGAPYVIGAVPATLSRPLLGVRSGSYELSLSYTLEGQRRSAVLTPYCTRALRGPPTVRAHPSQLQPGSHVTVARLQCPDGILWFRLDLPATTNLTVAEVGVTKTAAG